MSAQPLSLALSRWHKFALLLSIAGAFSMMMPLAKAQDGSSDPVTNVEVTVGGGSTGGMVSNNFAWRDKISTVGVIINCTNKNGKAVPNASVSISIASPGVVSPASGTTDGNGNVSCTVSSADINLDDANVTVSATSQGISGSGSVLLKGVQVVFAPVFIRMGAFKTATDTVSVKPAYDATNVSVTTTGQARASITSSTVNTNAGTILLTLTGKSGSTSKQGDEQLVQNIPGSHQPTATIEVVVPAAIGTKHPTYSGTVTPTNVALDATTSPAAPSVPAGSVYLATIYLNRMTIQVVDQFGDSLDSLYAGAPVVEDGNVPINVNLSGSGTYGDPVGVTMDRDNGPTTVLANSSDATQWTSILNGHYAPLSSVTYPPSNIAVSIGGFSLNPAIAGRVISSQAPNSLTITWPN